MRKIISFMHMSLDGFVAGKTGALDWVTVDQELFAHVGKRIAKSDTALYGRITYQMMESYWPTAGDQPNASDHDREHSKWYMDARKIVLSKTLNDEPNSKMSVIKNDLVAEINALKQTEGPEILVFGSPTATHSLIEHDLIDGYWLFLNPILLGEGIPLFRHVKEKTKLKLMGTKQFDNGVIELQYQK